MRSKLGRILLIVIAALIAIGLIFGQGNPSRDEAALVQLLHDFLAGASRNDAAMHDRFWAGNLIYTTSAGRRKGKAEIMADVRGAKPPAPGDPETVYTAEEVQLQLYGDVAVVAFRLVGTTSEGGRSTVARYLNTGTFVKRDGLWRAVAWQATKEPEGDPQHDGR